MTTSTIEDHVLDAFDQRNVFTPETSAYCVWRNGPQELGYTLPQVSAARQRLKRKGFVDHPHGTSWLWQNREGE